MRAELASSEKVWRVPAAGQDTPVAALPWPDTLGYQLADMDNVHKLAELGGPLAGAASRRRPNIWAMPVLWLTHRAERPYGILEVAPAAFDLQELLVAHGDVLGGELETGGPEQVLAVQVLLGLDRGGVGAEQPAGGDAQVPVQPGLGGDDAA